MAQAIDTELSLLKLNLVKKKKTAKKNNTIFGNWGKLYTTAGLPRKYFP